MELNSEQVLELSEFYWETDISTLELQEHFGLPKPAYRYIDPFVTDSVCPNCSEKLVYKSRSARESDEKICLDCGHKDRSIYTCHCSYCQGKKEAENQRRREEQKKKDAEALKARLEETSSPEYVSWAISKLSRREKIFLQSIFEILDENSSPSWQDISNRAKVVSHKKYVDKLLKVGLLHQHSDGIAPNPSVGMGMITIKKVRNISKSLRFDIFQRDGHICQYCGRKPPDVELEIDHLHPVAEGGTDEFENLVTSCFDCNRGKSAKVIQDHTGGYSKNEWRNVIKQKRQEALQTRRQQLEEVIIYWAECRGTNHPSHYDLEGIYTFIERYAPEWIKAAIHIAAQRSPSNYVKYVAGILRNWGENGPPDYISNPDLALEQKKATQKQKEYIKGLLENLGLNLEDFYHKTEYDELSMLDARNLIGALSESQFQDTDGS